jgi:RNA polymerase sigma factor (sigma-70 family)
VAPRDNASGVLRLVPGDPTAAPPQDRPARVALDDRALVDAVRAGQPAVASALCDRVWPQVDRTIRRLLGRGDADRDDVAQLALIELVNTIGRYRGDCSLDTWAQSVTAHVVFKHIRRRRLERRIFADLLDDDHGVPAPAQGDRSAVRELLARIGAHLDGIGEARAWAFVLHDVFGYDLREVAAMTKASVAATQSRLVRGRRDLHDRIAGDPELVELLSGVEGRA